MPYKLITPPQDEPLTLAETKLHLRVDTADEDTRIQSLIIAARELGEGITHRKFVTQTWEKYLDDWPLRIYQPRFFVNPSLGLGGSGYGYPVAAWPQPQDYIELLPGVQSVDWVKYYTRDGAEHVFDPANYQADPVSGPGRVMLMPDRSWPSEELRPANGICVRFTCGYGAAADVPTTIKAAMLLLIGHWFEHREAVNIERGTPLEIPFTVHALLAVETAMVV